MPHTGFDCSLSELYSSEAIIADCKPQPKTEEDERWEWLRELCHLAISGVKTCMIFALATLVGVLLYYPIARGYCWLILVIAYWMGDISVWPGPYTPHPSDGIL